MTTQSLLYFIQVYECGSISVAAADNFITPQGLSKAIKQIELEFGVELFSRETTGLVATNQGKLLYQKGKEMVNILADLKKSFNQMEEGRQLSFAVSQSAAHVFSADFIHGYLDLDQLSDIKIREVFDLDSVEHLLKKQCDFGIAVGEEQELEDYQMERIYTGELIVLIPQNHYLHHRDAIPLDTLRASEIVLHTVDEKFKKKFIEHCLENGFVPEIKQELMNYESAKRLCDMNNYIMITADFIEKSLDEKTLKAVRLMPGISQDIYLIYDKRIEQTENIKKIKSFLKSAERSVQCDLEMKISI